MTTNVYVRYLNLNLAVYPHITVGSRVDVHPM